MKSKFNPSQPFTCTCPDMFKGKNDLIFFLWWNLQSVKETDRYNLCLVYRNKYILFPNFFFFFFSQNKITEFLICLVKLKGAIKELWEIRRKLKKLEDSYYSQDEQWLLN